MTKPTSLPEWASSGSADIVEPLIAEKQIGWAESQKPPAGWFNWWQHLVWTWCVWLDAFESTAHTWTADQTFNSNVAVSGDLRSNGDFFATADADLANGATTHGAISDQTADVTPLLRNLVGPATTKRKLEFLFADGSGTFVRTYILTGSGFIPTQEVTYNAEWNDGASRWDRDSAIKPSRRMSFGQDPFRLERQTAGGANFVEASWVAELVTGSGQGAGVLDDDGNGIITRSLLKPYSSSGLGTPLPLEANVDDTLTCDYTLNFLGETVLSGIATANTTVTSGTKIAQLPVGFRPKRTTYRKLLENYTGHNLVYLRIQTNGAIDVMADGWSPPATFAFYLDGIRFDASI